MFHIFVCCVGFEANTLQHDWGFSIRIYLILYVEMWLPNVAFDDMWRFVVKQLAENSNSYHCESLWFLSMLLLIVEQSLKLVLLHLHNNDVFDRGTFYLIFCFTICAMQLIGNGDGAAFLETQSSVWIQCKYYTTIYTRTFYQSSSLYYGLCIVFNANLIA